MRLIEKYGRNKLNAFSCFAYLKGIKSAILACIFLFVFSTAFANEQAGSFKTEGNTIVYTANNDEGVIITSGKITAFEGKNIRLLPGTHIKSKEQLTVNIASKSEQELLAIRIAKEKEEAMLCTVSKLRNNLLSFTDNLVLPAKIKSGQAPAEDSTLGQQGSQMAALLVNTSTSFAAPLSYLNKQNTHFTIHQLPVLANHSYTPTNSWGESAEMVKVMRC